MNIRPRSPTVPEQTDWKGKGPKERGWEDHLRLDWRLTELRNDVSADPEQVAWQRDEPANENTQEHQPLLSRVEFIDVPKDKWK